MEDFWGEANGCKEKPLAVFICVYLWLPNTLSQEKMARPESPCGEDLSRCFCAVCSLRGWRLEIAACLFDDASHHHYTITPFCRREAHGELLRAA
jgi:hypothetical protein